MTLAGIISVLFAVTGVQSPPPDQGCHSLLGVWEYISPSVPGRGIIAKQGQQYVGMNLQISGESAKGGAPQTDAEKAAAFDRTMATVWEFTCESSGGVLRLKSRTLLSLRPQQTGTEFRAEMEVKGDDAQWFFIRPDGTRGAKGAARRIR